MKAYAIVLCLTVSAVWMSLSHAHNQTRYEPSLREATTYVCDARNTLGRRFSATGEDRVLTQEAAMRACEAVSFRCFRWGCRP